MHPSIAALLQLAGSQLGIFTYRHAIDLGVRPATLVDLQRAGVIERIGPSVYRVTAAPRTWDQRALAAVWSVGVEDLVCRRSAAHVWNLEGFGPPGRIAVVTSAERNPRRRPGVRVHRSKAFDLASPTVRRGIPVTGLARTILDVCAESGRDWTDPLRALDDARRRGLVSWPDLWTCLATHACRGRNGIVLYRQILLKRWGARHPGGDFARMVERLLDSAGLPAPEFEHPVRLRGNQYFIDLAYPELKIAIELIGRIGHDNEASFDSDPRRRNALLLDGWIVIEFTWNRFVDDPAGVVREIRAAIALRSAAR